jgi:hypothetical protein
VSVVTNRHDEQGQHGKPKLEAEGEMAMYGYLNQLVAETHIRELRAQAARQRLVAQAARASRGRKSALIAASAAPAGPISAGVTRSASLRVRPAADC